MSVPWTNVSFAHLLMMHSSSHRDLAGHQPPLLLNDVPEHLRADDGDGAQQHIILDAICANKFNDLLVKKVLLSKLKNDFEKNNVNAALDLLRSRWEVEFDIDYQYSAHDPYMAYSFTGHYLDFLMVLSKGTGFGACLAPSPNDMTFVFHLDLHQPHRALKMKHIDLGFPVYRNALFIGRSRGKDQVYIVMAPNTFLDHSPGDDPLYFDDTTPHNGPKLTNMSGRHYFMLVMYMAFIYQEHFPDCDVYCNNPYPNLEEHAWRNVHNATNILYVALLPFTCVSSMISYVFSSLGTVLIASSHTDGCISSTSTSVLGGPVGSTTRQPTGRLMTSLLSTHPLPSSSALVRTSSSTTRPHCEPTLILSLANDASRSVVPCM